MFGMPLEALEQMPACCRALLATQVPASLLSPSLRLSSLPLRSLRGDKGELWLLRRRMRVCEVRWAASKASPDALLECLGQEID